MAQLGLVRDPAYGVRYLLAAFGLLLAVTYVPGILDASTEPRWAVAAILAPAVVLFSEVDRLPCVAWAFGALLTACSSLLWSVDPVGGAGEAMRLFIMFASFWAGASVRPRADFGSTYPVGMAFWIWLVVGLLPCAFLVALQVGDIGPGWVVQTAAPGGTFANQNFLGEAAAVGLIVSVYLRSWPCALAMFFMLGAAHTLTAWGGAIVAGLLWLWPRRPRAALILFGALLVAFYFWMGKFTGRANDLYISAVSYVTFFGNGLGAYAAQWPEHEHLHNDLLQGIFELGILMLPAVAIALTALKDQDNDTEMERLIFAAVLAMGLFSYSAHMPLTAVAGAFAAGAVLGHRDRLRRALNGRADHLGDRDGRAAAWP